MKVLVYVEGPADRVALQALLRLLLGEAQGKGIGIQFLPLGGKERILKDVGLKAAGHLKENQTDWVFALPDLYPMGKFANTDLAHGCLDEMRDLLIGRFRKHAQRVGLPEALHHRLRVHCLKHDLEALLLAAPRPLGARLGTRDHIQKHWRLPVEDQNDQRYPKRVIDELFKKYRPKPGYVEVTDAPWILERADLAEVVAACPQCFGPFVGELRTIINGGVLS